jgi:cytochrome c oxidase subunit IV
MAFVFERQAKLYRSYGCQILNNSILAIYGFVFESQAKSYIVDNFGINGFLFFGRIPVFVLLLSSFW